MSIDDSVILSSSSVKSDVNDQKGSGYINLPILLSELSINNSKELKSNIKHLLNHLYDTKQTTKQVYNSLIKAITYKNYS